MLWEVSGTTPWSVAESGSSEGTTMKWATALLLVGLAGCTAVPPDAPAGLPAMCQMEGSEFEAAVIIYDQLRKSGAPYDRVLDTLILDCTDNFTDPAERADCIVCVTAFLDYVYYGQ
jgi:hypothetical protein